MCMQFSWNYQIIGFVLHMFCFTRHFRTVFQKGCNYWTSARPVGEILLLCNSAYHFFFFNSSHCRGCILVSMVTSLMTNIDFHLFTIYWPLTYSLLWSVLAYFFFCPLLFFSWAKCFFLALYKFLICSACTSFVRFFFSFTQQVYENTFIHRQSFHM